ncbi:Cytosolic iron-sulfur protein assembly protein [Rhodotorula toruloides]
MTRVRLLDTLEGHQDRAWHVAWNPAQPTLASCSTDKSVRLYSYAPASATSAEADSSTAGPSSYRFALKSTIPTSHSRTVRSLSFSPTGATLATASFDSTVGIWCQVSEAGLDDGEGAKGDEWEAVDPLEGHENECKSVAWSSDGRLLASCSRDKSVWVWEAVGPADFECLAVLMEHSQDVKCVTWHPTDELLASASYDDTIKLYGADPYDDEWTCIHTLTSHTATVWTLSFSPCGRYLASAGDDLVIKLWERVSLLEDDEKRSEVLGEVGEAKREEGGRMGPWSSGGVRIGMKERWKWVERGQIEGAHERTVYAVDWARGGVSEEEGGLGRIITAGGDGRINVFQMTKPTSPDAPPTHTLLETIEDAHGVSDVNHVAWCHISPSSAAAKLRALEGGEADPADDGEDESGVKEDARWERAGDMFASAGDDGLVRVWIVDSEGAKE